MGVFRQLHDAYRHAGDWTDTAIIEQVRVYERAERLIAERVDAVLLMYFELGCLDEVERVALDPVNQSYLGPVGRYTLARAHYVRRRFSLALEQLEFVRGSARHWEGEKLRSRILYELGRVDDALEHRAANHRHSDGLDEVVYHSYLYQRRYKEAFAIYCAEVDAGRLRQVFGEHAEAGPEFPSVESRLIAPQGGPGDEILLASTSPSLERRSGELTALCDPRLESLLARSFPSIRFLSVERQKSRRHEGFVAADRPKRADNVLFDLFDEQAFAEAARCERVVLGRSLPVLSLEPDHQAPYSPYLSPDPAQLNRFSSRGLGDGGTIGVVWRSEFNSPMRSIHYMELHELAPLLEGPGTFVCLQHDATPGERAELDRLTGGRVHFPDDVDVRDDFEAAAGLVACLDVVVGVGTTILELAAAVGTNCVSMQPTLFSTWRRIDDECRDYWHTNMRVATVDDATQRQVCAERARVLVDQALNEALTPT